MDLVRLVKSKLALLLLGILHPMFHLKPFSVVAKITIPRPLRSHAERRGRQVRVVRRGKPAHEEHVKPTGVDELR